jgi:RNA polymerase sigma factor (TIGR02999 family)
MPAVSKAGITELLNAWSNGDQSALNKLASLILPDLRRIAKHHLDRERPGHSLQTTALVNEAYLRLVGMRKVNWKDRAHFFAASAQLIRHILVDAARARGSRKRGGYVVKVTLTEALAVSDRRSADLVALDDALNTLSAVDPRKAKMVELRFFGGLSVKETAEVLHVAPNTVLRDWKLAKAWLWREIKGTKDHDARTLEAN